MTSNTCLVWCVLSILVCRKIHVWATWAFHLSGHGSNVEFEVHREAYIFFICVVAVFQERWEVNNSFGHLLLQLTELRHTIPTANPSPPFIARWHPQRLPFQAASHEISKPWMCPQLKARPDQSVLALNRLCQSRASHMTLYHRPISSNKAEQYLRTRAAGYFKPDWRDALRMPRAENASRIVNEHSGAGGRTNEDILESAMMATAAKLKCVTALWIYDVLVKFFTPYQILTPSNVALAAA